VERNNGCSSDSALRYHPYALLTPRIRQPGLAFPHPLWRGRPTPLGSTSCPRGGPRLRTADSTLQSHSSPLPQDLLLGLPLGADLEQVAPCLRPAGERRALSAGSALRPIQALPGEAATSLQLVEPRGEPLRATRSGSIRLLPARHLVLFRGGRASSPHLHGNLSPEVRAGSGEWHRMCLRLLAIPPCGRLPPPLRAWPRAPPDLSGNVWPGARTSGRCQAPPTPCA